MARSFTDQMGRNLSVCDKPSRIISIVPSQTELLYDLGLNDEVIGITKFCVHPEKWFRTKNRVGGTKQLNIDLIGQLKPDLIIGNKEENSIEDIQALEKIAPVWMSDIYTIDDAVNMIREVGKLVIREQKAEFIADTVSRGFEDLKQCFVQRTFLYFIWKDPDYLAGDNTFINNVLETAGFVNHCRDERYPEWSTKYGEPDIVFLSTEPYPFKKDHVIAFKERFQGSEIMMIDGEMCSWYGSRMLKAIDYFKDLQNKFSRSLI